MSTLDKPGRFDCYATLKPDEPYFVLTGRDRHAGLLVRLWALMRENDGEAPDCVAEARLCATEMDRWLHEHGRRRLPDGFTSRVLADVSQHAAGNEPQAEFDL
jgi:hypothetical protein